MKIKVIQTTINVLENTINTWLINTLIAHIYTIDYHVYPNNDVLVVIRYEEKKQDKIK